MAASEFESIDTLTGLPIDPLTGLPREGVRVKTDQEDYAPGSTAYVTATGFESGSTIEFAIQEDPNRPGDDGIANIYKPFSVTDGGEGDLDGVADGNITTTWLVPVDPDGDGPEVASAMNATLHLTATGKGADGTFGTADDQVAKTTFTDAGGSYTISWRAADPATNKGSYLPTYDKITPQQWLATNNNSYPTGRATNPLANSVAYASPATSSNLDAVASLAPKDMALGQIVPFQVEITVNGSTTPENGVIQFTPYWLTKTTNGADFGFDPNYRVIAAFVDAADPGTTDPGNNATVTSFTSSIAFAGTSNEQIQSNIQLSGLNTGDKVIVEIWVVLKDTIPAGSQGNVQTGSSQRTDSFLHKLS
jgi:hypothetical protein